MKLEVFTEILNKLRKQSDKQDALYDLDVELHDHNSNRYFIRVLW
jgi:hypothetical protein